MNSDRTSVGKQHFIARQRRPAREPATVYRIVTASVLAISFLLVISIPAIAQSIEDYFQFNYEPVTFSKKEVHGTEVFYATIRGHVACIRELPVKVSGAKMTSRVVAEQAVSGERVIYRVILNSSYTVTIDPFPSKQGDVTEINIDVPLEFPAEAESGDYNVKAELTEAEVKIGFATINVIGYLPQYQQMGMVKYAAEEPTPTSSPEHTTPTPPPSPMLKPEPTLPQGGIIWWVWLIVGVAVATTVWNIIWYLRHRTL